MAEAYKLNEGTAVPFTAGQAYAGGEVIQLADGRAAVVVAAVTSGAQGSAYVTGEFAVVKTSGVVILDGGRTYWDYSANAAHYKKVNDRDFYIGRNVGDAASTATIMAVALNENPADDLDLARDAFATAVVGTQALGGLALNRRGGAHNIVLSATNEAQKVDALGKDGFARTANAIVEVLFNVIANGTAAAVVDVSLGVANGTNATDADAIAEHLFVHLDSNALAIKVQSKDGTTTVAATDTTTTFTAGSGNANRVEVWFDLRNEASIKVYVNAVQVLTGTTFRLDNATGPLRLLAHVEKTLSTDTYEIDVERLSARFGE